MLTRQPYSSPVSCGVRAADRSSTGPVSARSVLGEPSFADRSTPRHPASPCLMKNIIGVRILHSFSHILALLGSSSPDPTLVQPSPLRFPLWPLDLPLPGCAASLALTPGFIFSPFLYRRSGPGSSSLGMDCPQHL